MEEPAPDPPVEDDPDEPDEPDELDDPEESEVVEGLEVVEEPPEVVDVDDVLLPVSDRSASRAEPNVPAERLSVL